MGDSEVGMNLQSSAKIQKQRVSREVQGGAWEVGRGTHPREPRRTEEGAWTLSQSERTPTGTSHWWFEVAAGRVFTPEECVADAMQALSSSALEQTISVLKTPLSLLCRGWIMGRWYCNEHSWTYCFDCSSRISLGEVSRSDISALNYLIAPYWKFLPISPLPAVGDNFYVPAWIVTISKNKKGKEKKKKLIC